MKGQQQTTASGIELTTGTSRLRAFACDRCSKRKTRCDRQLPRCSACDKADVVCEATSRESAVLPAGDNINYRKGYVRLLEEELHGLESQVQAVNPGMHATSVGIENDTNGQSTQNSESSAEHRALSQPAEQPAEAAEVNIQLLSLSAMAEPRNRAGEFLRELSMPRIISAVTETYGGDPEHTTRIDVLWDGIAKYIRQSNDGSTRQLVFPQTEAAKSLKAYLEVVDFRYPRIPVVKVQHGFEAIADTDGGLYQSTLSTDPAHIFLAYMIIAVTPLVSDIHPVAQGSFISTHILAMSLKVLDKVFQKEDGADIIHCLHILVIYSIHSSTAGSSWHLIGIAMRKCVALGYHLEPAEKVGSEEAAARRWAFWSCYLLDRLISAALGRPPSLNDRYITVKLPGYNLPRAVIASPDAMQTHLLRYATVLSTVTRQAATESFEQRLGKILDWRSKRPAHADELRRDYQYQTSLYHTSLLRITIERINDSQTVRLKAGTDGSDATVDGTTGAELVQQADLIRDLRLTETCNAVFDSLNRPDMRERPFLSWITGYSTFSVALAILYRIGLLVALRALGQAHPLDDAHDALVAANIMLNELMSKLGVVARQFPRLNEFRWIVASLRWNIDGYLLDEWQSLDRATPLGDYETVADKIAPLHLKVLAERLVAILKVVPRPMD
jgi:hypothetical protein